MLSLKRIIGVMFLAMFMLTSSTAFGAFNGYNIFDQSNDTQKDRTATEDAMSVTIDVMPGDDQKTIDPQRDQTLEVAVLGSKDFDVNDIDQNSLTWNDKSIDAQSRVVDINDDGIDDLLLRVQTKDLNLEGDSADITVRGKTDSGQQFEGSDSLTMESSQQNKQ